MNENTNLSMEQQVAAFLGENEIDWDKLKPIICFVILWNRLELVHGQHLSLRRLESSVSEAIKTLYFDISRYKPHIKFFEERYSNSPELFSTLFRPNPPPDERRFEEWLERMIKGDSLSAEQRIKAILYIPYRIRNNLFHGRKNTIHLYAQTDLFTHVNEVLCLFHADLF